MFRYAYPASVERQDVCTHGTAEAAQKVHDLEDQERKEGKEEDYKMLETSIVYKQQHKESYQIKPGMRG